MQFGTKWKPEECTYCPKLIEKPEDGALDGGKWCHRICLKDQQALYRKKDEVVLWP